MAVESISAITLAVMDMARSVVFYRDYVGLEMLYGGEQARFTSFRLAGSFVNLILTEDQPQMVGEADLLR